MTAGPIPYTLLSLHRYAQIMGINPTHFSGAYGDEIWPINNNSCQDIWVRHSWQYGDMVSREDIARAIVDAENDVARILGYWPAPKWIESEPHPYPRFHRHDRMSLGGKRQTDGKWKSVQSDWAKVVDIGRRAVTLIDTATVAGGTMVFSDTDGNGFDDTVTITLPTTVTDVREVKVYFAGTGADQDWEIRPVRSVTISGGNVVVVADSWLFLDPDKQAATPTYEGFKALNILTASNYVASVDVYREYTDNTTFSAKFFWEPDSSPFPFPPCTSCGGSGCPACSQTIQNGCSIIRDVDTGVIVPVPATYDETDERWETVQFTECREPEQVKIYYRAGDVDQAYLRGTGLDPLSHRMAQTIAWLATARLERPFCGCSNVTSLGEYLRTDRARTGEDGSFLVNFETLDNPLGMKTGELLAWHRLSRMGERQLSVGLI